MKMKMTRRTIIRIGSYLTALVLVLGIGTAVGYNHSRYYKRQLESTYMRSLEELGDYVTGISNTLNKGVYAGTPAQLSTLSSKLWRDAGSAKAALASLPISELDLEGTYKFLSQVGDYSMNLSKKVAAGGTLTGEETENLAALLDYARQLTGHIANLERQISTGDLNLDDIALAAKKSREADDETKAEQNPDENLLGFEEMEDSFQGYPKLIYDGPFSDHLLERPALLLEGQGEVTVETALAKAASCAGLSPSALTHTGDENSNMASYCFSGADFSAGVTKKGGYLAYLTNSRQVGDRVLTNEEALKKAKEYLGTLGLKNMEQSYYEIANGVCTVNFAYTQNTVTCYTDLVKIGVALDDGQVVFVDSRGYITNHHERSIPAPSLSMEEALGSVSKNLSPKGSGMAIIPTSGMNEVLVYEFRCVSEDGQNVLVYVNAATGAEEQILLLIESEEGVLTV